MQFGSIEYRDGRLRIPVEVDNLAGHKLPTSFPSRRVWIRFEVRDQSGQPVFISGGFNRHGQLIDRQGAPLASELVGGSVLPHFQRITKSTEVQVYESIMADKTGDLTFTLLRGAKYLKDNRLLPRGWKPDHPDAARTVPVGIGNDTDFRSGSDTVTYDLPVKGKGPWSVHAMLVMQVLSARDAAELLKISSPEIERFDQLYQTADRRPELITSIETKCSATSQ